MELLRLARLQGLACVVCSAYSKIDWAILIDSILFFFVGEGLSAVFFLARVSPQFRCRARSMYVLCFFLLLLLSGCRRSMGFIWQVHGVR